MKGDTKFYTQKCITKNILKRGKNTLDKMEMDSWKFDINMYFRLQKNLENTSTDMKHIWQDALEKKRKQMEKDYGITACKVLD